VTAQVGGIGRSSEFRRTLENGFLLVSNSFKRTARRPRTSCASELEAFDPTELRGKLEDRKNVFAFQVRVIGQDFLMGHARTEPFEHMFDRVTQSTHARFAVADVRVDGDAVIAVEEFEINCFCQRSKTHLERNAAETRSAISRDACMNVTRICCHAVATQAK
jgi:hypothetical protein